MRDDPPHPPPSRDTLSTNDVSLNHTCLLLAGLDVGRLGGLAVDGLVWHALSSFLLLLLWD